MERAAIISEDYGLSRIASETCALEAIGLKSSSDFVDAHAARISTLIRQWRGEPSRRARISRNFLTSDEASRLASVTLDFIATDHFREALRLKWTDVQLFCVCRDAPWVRVESWGLITGPALSPHNRLNSQGHYHQTKLDCCCCDDHHAYRLTRPVRPLARRLGLAAPWWEVFELQI
jgi:hypothetical protein